MRRTTRALLAIAIVFAPLLSSMAASPRAGAATEPNRIVDGCVHWNYWGCSADCADGAITGNGSLIGYNTEPGGIDRYGHPFCPAQWQSGMMSIGGHKTHTYTLTHTNISPVAACYWRSSSAIWPSAGIAWGSSSYTAYNSVSDTRHWAFGASLYAPSNTYSTPAGYNATQCQTENGCIGYGLAAGCWSTAAAEATAAAAAPGAATAAGARFAPTLLPVTTPTTATTDPALTVLDVVADRVGTRSVTCPAGTSVLHADTAIRQPEQLPVVEPLVDHDHRTARFTIRQLNSGAVVDLHVACRATGATSHTSAGGHITGTDGHEKHTTHTDGQHVMSGGGNDTITVRHGGTSVVAGHGNDQVETHADDGSVHGGPGRDRLVAKGTGSVLLEGGSGPDVLVAERGTPMINAEDGKAGDQIICLPGSNATVVMDKGDIVRGTCTILRRS